MRKIPNEEQSQYQISCWKNYNFDGLSSKI